MERTIREWRAKYQLTQEQLATIIEVRPATVGDWENGKTRPRMENLEKLAGAFQTDISKIIFLPSNRKIITNFKKGNAKAK